MIADKFGNTLRIGVPVIITKYNISGPFKIIHIAGSSVYVDKRYFNCKYIISADHYKQTNPEYFI